MHLSVALSLPAEERLVPAARKAVGELLMAADLPEGAVDDVILALDEACSNVLQHAFPHGGPGSYELRADVRPGEVVIDVIDHGVGFDPMDRRPAEIMDVTGRGFEIMRRVMTRVEVESPTLQGGTRLRLCKQLPEARGSG
jgi:phosphoserine phosphatase RsbU/P